MQQHFYIYPQKLAQEAKELLIHNWGWSDEDFDSYLETAKTLETQMHNINCTLLHCYWETNGPATTWNIKLSTPGHCDIFQLIEAIRLTFDLNGLDDHFSFIDAAFSYVSISFTVNA